MRILVTNDDGVDAVGLHVLAQRLVDLGDVVVAAPDREYSGAGAAVGTLHLIRPEVRRVELDGRAGGLVGHRSAGAVRHVRPARRVRRRLRPRRLRDQPRRELGPGDLPLGHRGGGAHRAQRRRLRAGREPGGRRLRRRGPGLGRDAGGPALGHAPPRWAPAWRRRSSPPSRATRSVLNVNVPNRPLDEMAGWRRTEVALLPPRTLASAALTPKVGHDDAFDVRMEWGDPIELPDDTDSGAVEAGYISVTAAQSHARRPVGGPRGGVRRPRWARALVLVDDRRRELRAVEPEVRRRRATGARRAIPARRCGRPPSRGSRRRRGWWRAGGR